MRNKKGFTLAELLVMVAIVGVLVAISIPVFTGQLKRARAAVDQANVRSAKAAAAAEYLTDGSVSEKTYYYDASKGTVVGEDEKDSITGYGKSNEELLGDLDDYATGVPKDAYVSVTVNVDGTITASWEGGNSGGDTPKPPADPNSLIQSDKFKSEASSGNLVKYTSYDSIIKYHEFNNIKVGQGIKEGEYLYVCINTDVNEYAKTTDADKTMSDYYNNHTDSNIYFYRVEDSTPIIINAKDTETYPENSIKMEADKTYYILVNGKWNRIIKLIIKFHI